MIGLIQVTDILVIILFIDICRYLTDLFADGDDFSEETIDKNRNIYYQKQMVSRMFILLLGNNFII
jgi:hypothetical protein